MFPSRMLLNNLFNDFDSTKNYDKLMKCDIYEENNFNIFEIDLPGFKKDDIKLDLENGYLVVSAEKKNTEENNDENKNYIHRERYYHTKCERSFYIGEISENNIKATFNDGILKIKIPKEDEQQKSKKTISID